MAELSSAILLVFSIIIDVIGFSTYMVPVVGETFDLVWAPLSAFMIYAMYGRDAGLLAIVNLIEELAPGLDFIPTASIAWFYFYGR